MNTGSTALGSEERGRSFTIIRNRGYWNKDKDVLVSYRTCNLNQRLGLMGNLTNRTLYGECRCPETAKHVFLECSTYNTEKTFFYFLFYKRLSDLNANRVDLEREEVL